VADNPDVQVRFKHYPISNECNDNVGGPGHERACAAAMATECARQQGRFWPYSRLLFKNQGNLDPEGLRFMADQVGLDLEAFAACTDSEAPLAVVKEDVRHAAQVGVHGTPALFLKGVTGEDWVRVRGGALEALVLIELHRSGEALPPTPPATPEM
ncbi:MAG: DsbA family protein, partial [Myxococcota bacterium]|nr:DsbA family protein [Myxococcota bacterium]